MIGPNAVFPAEKVVVCREAHRGVYKLSAYYAARVLAEFPGQVLGAGR